MVIDFGASFSIFNIPLSSLEAFVCWTEDVLASFAWTAGMSGRAGRFSIKRNIFSERVWEWNYSLLFMRIEIKIEIYGKTDTWVPFQNSTWSPLMCRQNRGRRSRKWFLHLSWIRANSVSHRMLSQSKKWMYFYTKIHLICLICLHGQILMHLIVTTFVLDERFHLGLCLEAEIGYYQKERRWHFGFLWTFHWLHPGNR